MNEWQISMTIGFEKAISCNQAILYSLYPGSFGLQVPVSLPIHSHSSDRYDDSLTSARFSSCLTIIPNELPGDITLEAFEKPCPLVLFTASLEPELFEG